MPVRMARAVALLAAGQGRRFGADKLSAPLRGKMLGLHAADTLAQVPFDRRWVIVADLAHPCVSGWQAAGFEAVCNPEAATGMGTSVALAGNLAAAAGVDQLLIALADMPLVPAGHFAALLEQGRRDGEHAMIASSEGRTPMPPALFGSARFARLALSQGDSGARAMLVDATLVAAPPGSLTDVDDAATLAALQDGSMDRLVSQTDHLQVDRTINPPNKEGNYGGRDRD